MQTVSEVAIFVYVIAWLGVKFGINFMSVVVRMAKIARDEAECNFAILTTTQVNKISLLAML